MPVSQFGKPVPGNSLTTHKPGERSWERPPEVASVEDALAFYMKRLSNDDIMDDFMVALESGIPLKPMVESLYMSHVMRGIHTLDVGILIAPALMEFFAAVADSYDIKYKFSGKDPKKEMKERERARITMLLNAAIDKAEDDGMADEGTDMLREMMNYAGSDMSREEAAEAAPEEAPVEAEPMQGELPLEEPQPAPTAAPSGAGLMSPRG